MRNLPTDFKTHLETKCTTLCYCAAIIRDDGFTIGFSEHDRDLEFEEIVFKSNNGCDLTSFMQTSGANYDTGELIGVLRDDGITSEDILNGKYENAKLSIWRVNWNNPEQRVLLKYGSLGNLSKTAMGLQLEFLGLTAPLDQTIGRLYQRDCDACLGDDRCKVDVSQVEYQIQASIIENDETSLKLSILLEFPANWFANGVLRFLDGSARDIERRIVNIRNTNDATTVQLSEKLPTYDLTGSSVLLTAGCDKSLQSCREKFSNLHNFRGFPHMPGNDFIIRVPTSGEVNDGGRR